MRKFITFALLLLVACPLYADTIERYRNLKSCVFAEDLGDYHAIEKKYTISSAPTIVDSVWGKAMDFDGTDDKVACSNVKDTIKTCVIWVNPDTTTEQFVDFDGGSVYIDVSSGTLRGQGWTSPTLYVNGSASSTMTADTWQMIAVTSATAISPTTISIGTDGTNFGDCSIAKVLCFNRELSATEIEQIYKGTAFDYEIETVLKSDCSQINPVDLYGSFNGTGTGLAAANITEGHRGGKAISFNGTDEKVDFGDVGTISSVSMWVNPLSTTEELFLVDTGNDVMLNAGTVTYATLTKVNTFVDGVDTDTMVANKWQHLVCVFTAVDANNFELANDGANFGNIEVDSVTAYSGALEQAEAEDIYARSR